jgi:hypothetical protein
MSSAQSLDKSDEKYVFDKNTRYVINFHKSLRLYHIGMLLSYLYPKYDIGKNITEWNSSKKIHLQMHAQKSTEDFLYLSIAFTDEGIVFYNFSSDRCFQIITERIGNLEKFQTILDEFQTDPTWGNHYICVSCDSMYNRMHMRKLYWDGYFIPEPIREVLEPIKKEEHIIKYIDKALIKTGSNLFPLECISIIMSYMPKDGECCYCDD